MGKMLDTIQVDLLAQIFRYQMVMEEKLQAEFVPL